MKILYFIPFIFLMACQEREPVFNQRQFSLNLDSARWLADYHHYTQLALDMYHQETGKKGFFHYSFCPQGKWITVIGKAEDGHFVAEYQTIQISADSLVKTEIFLNQNSANIYISAFLIAIGNVDPNDTDSLYQKYSILIRRHPDLSFTVWAFPINAMVHDFSLPIYRFAVKANGYQLNQTSAFYLDINQEENVLLISNGNVDQPGIAELFFTLQSPEEKILIQNNLFQTTYTRKTGKWAHRYAPVHQNQNN